MLHESWTLSYYAHRTQKTVLGRCRLSLSCLQSKSNMIKLGGRHHWKKDRKKEKTERKKRQKERKDRKKESKNAGSCKKNFAFSFSSSFLGWWIPNSITGLITGWWGTTINRLGPNKLSPSRTDLLYDLPAVGTQWYKFLSFFLGWRRPIFIIGLKPYVNILLVPTSFSMVNHFW